MNINVNGTNRLAIARLVNTTNIIPIPSTQRTGSIEARLVRMLRERHVGQFRVLPCGAWSCSHDLSQVQLEAAFLAITLLTAHRAAIVTRRSTCSHTYVNTCVRAHVSRVYVLKRPRGRRPITRARLAAGRRACPLSRAP
ncbi:hypothetical protein EVAR_24774_1 [Eumeta japonica]|uniref:Uncharacterized protein n=1 Tax=Eumeta variegata TaxID=151549 RepID=A0A4C1W1B4_EUMVA|nr:hypothetical protein EVAR_24774_1 [Eumeta japonica]